jgi:hypothetical protein
MGGSSFPLILNCADAVNVSNDKVIASIIFFLVIFLFFRAVFLYYQVIDDKVLTLHRVFTHIIFQQLLHLIVLVERHLFQTDIRADKACELIR